MSLTACIVNPKSRRSKQEKESQNGLGEPSLVPDYRATSKYFLTLDSAEEITRAGDRLNHQAKAKERDDG
jgi:hypothetical protein